MTLKEVVESTSHSHDERNTVEVTEQRHVFLFCFIQKGSLTWGKLSRGGFFKLLGTPITTENYFNYIIVHFRYII
jgi:hypothetical protein